MNATLADVDERRRQVEVVFPAEVVDSYQTSFAGGAFADGFKRRLPTICWMHNLTEPIGHAVRAQSLRDRTEVVGQFSDFGAVPLARRAFAQLRDGDIADFSFSFERQGDQAHPEVRSARRITRAFMVEMSPVTIGSIPGARAISVRSRGFRRQRTTNTDPRVIELDHVLALAEQRLRPGFGSRWAAEEAERYMAGEDRQTSREYEEALVRLGMRPR